MPVGLPEEIHTAVLKFYSDPGLKKLMGVAARKRVGSLRSAGSPTDSPMRTGQGRGPRERFQARRGSPDAARPLGDRRRAGGLCR